MEIWNFYQIRMEKNTGNGPLLGTSKWSVEALVSVEGTPVDAGQKYFIITFSLITGS
jgi:hypothetical protein